MTLDIQQFDPTVKELNELVEATRYISLADLGDAEQLKVVKEARIKLRDARVKIEKKGKELRADATAFGKAVIAKEKELIGIVEPEEDRLKALEEQAAEVAEMKKREKLLPERMEKLLAIGDGIEVADSTVLLKMDDAEFEAYYNKRVYDKNEKARLDLERREREVKEKEAAQKREEDRIAAEERGRVAERERIEKETKEKEAREEQKRKDEEARIERERIEKERKEREAKEKLERDVAYNLFLEAHGYVAGKDFRIETVEGEVRLYKLVATHTL